MPRAYQCRDCLYKDKTKWTNYCPGCGRLFNIKEINVSDMPGAEVLQPKDGELISLGDVVAGIGDTDEERIETKIPGLDLVLGGGIVPGSMILLCGSPGCGKSTLLMEALNNIARQRYDVIYTSGEETLKQIGSRAKRMGIKIAGRFQMLYETDMDSILDKVDDVKPAIVVIDSAQTLFIDDDLEIGSVATIKIAIREFMRFAKQTDEKVTFIIIGHIKKDGGLAGPKVLEHMVDTNLFFKSNPLHSIRTLLCESKNRFGGTPVEAKFEMTPTGLIEYKEPPPEPAPEKIIKPETMTPQEAKEAKEKLRHLKSVPLDLPKAAQKKLTSKKPELDEDPPPDRPRPKSRRSVVVP